MATDSWKFAPAFDPVRRERLLALRDFAETAALIRASARAIQLEACWGRDVELRGCVQAVYTLSISKPAFDAFFNSPVGYRGGYLEDPSIGVLNNLRLIDLLLERLVGVAHHECVAELSHIDVRASLLATSCKVWMHEDDFPFDRLSEDLAIEAWSRAAASGEIKARWGLCAPEASRIQIKGALLDRAGNEVVPRKKVLRRYDLHRFGFS